MQLRTEVLPNFIHLFNGLKKAVALREEDGDGEDGDEAEIDDDEDGELDELEDDQDVIDSDAQDYAEILKELNNGDDVDWEGETGLEGYTTDIDDDEMAENDEYLIFQNTIMNLEKSDPTFYQGITAHLTTEFRNVSAHKTHKGRITAKPLAFFSVLSR